MCHSHYLRVLDVLGRERWNWSRKHVEGRPNLGEAWSKHFSLTTEAGRRGCPTNGQDSDRKGKPIALQSIPDRFLFSLLCSASPFISFLSLPLLLSSLSISSAPSVGLLPSLSSPGLLPAGSVLLFHFQLQLSRRCCCCRRRLRKMSERGGFYKQDLNKTVWEVPQRYQHLTPVGSGAYGSVW